MRIVTFSLATALVATSGVAMAAGSSPAPSYTLTSTSYSQNFDSLASSGTSQSLPAGFQIATGATTVAGALVGGPVGAVVGAGVGVGLGAAVVLRQDQQQELPAGTGLILGLDTPLDVRTAAGTLTASGR